MPSFATGSTPRPYNFSPAAVSSSTPIKRLMTEYRPRTRIGFGSDRTKASMVASGNDAWGVARAPWCVLTAGVFRELRLRQTDGVEYSLGLTQSRGIPVEFR